MPGVGRGGYQDRTRVCGKVAPSWEPGVSLSSSYSCVGHFPACKMRGPESAKPPPSSRAERGSCCATALFRSRSRPRTRSAARPAPALSSATAAAHTPTVFAHHDGAVPERLICTTFQDNVHREWEFGLAATDKPFTQETDGIFLCLPLTTPSPTRLRRKSIRDISFWS